MELQNNDMLERDQSRYASVGRKITALKRENVISCCVMKFVSIISPLDIAETVRQNI